MGGPYSVGARELTPLPRSVCNTALKLAGTRRQDAREPAGDDREPWQQSQPWTQAPRRVLRAPSQAPLPCLCAWCAALCPAATQTSSLPPRCVISPPVLPPRGGTALGNTHFNGAGANCLRAGLLLFRRQEPPGRSLLSTPARTWRARQRQRRRETRFIKLCM